MKKNSISIIANAHTRREEPSNIKMLIAISTDFFRQKTFTIPMGIPKTKDNINAKNR